MNIPRLINTLSLYRRNKAELMPMYIEERLTKSLAQYDKELQQGLEILTHKHEKSILKRLSK